MYDLNYYEEMKLAEEGDLDAMFILRPTSFGGIRLLQLSRKPQNLRSDITRQTRKTGIQIRCLIWEPCILREEA